MEKISYVGREDFEQRDRNRDVEFSCTDWDSNVLFAEKEVSVNSIYIHTLTLLIVGRRESLLPFWVETKKIKIIFYEKKPKFIFQSPS